MAIDYSDVNFWTSYKTGNNFLSHLRDKSHAREFCRNKILELIQANKIRSILEVGVGGLNEFHFIKPMLEAYPHVRYTGTDWTERFISDAAAKYPDYRWQRLDIMQEVSDDSLVSDLVYSQHVLEHCPGLNPPLTNMLKLAAVAVFNIFFIPPAKIDLIDWRHYPLYHNTYGSKHITTVCRYHGFKPYLVDFDNINFPDAEGCRHETVLAAVRKSEMGSDT